jgi:hypothetical protein
MSSTLVAADVPAGSLVGIAHARGPPLAVGRMAIDSDKVNQSVSAVIVLQPIL